MVTSDSTPNTWAHVAAKGATKPKRQWRQSNRGDPPERTVWPGIGMFPFCRRPDDHRHPARYWWGTARPQSPTKAWSLAAGRGRPPADITTWTVPQEVTSVDAEMAAFDDRPTRHTVRPLHANTQGEVSREWEGNDAAPSDGETQMAPLQLSPKRNKKLKTDREKLLSRERTCSKTRYKPVQSQ